MSKDLEKGKVIVRILCKDHLFESERLLGSGNLFIDSDLEDISRGEHPLSTLRLYIQRFAEMRGLPLKKHDNF